MIPAERVKAAINKVLPFAKASIVKGSIIDWVDIELAGCFVSIECHSDTQYGVAIENIDSKPFARADYYFDNQFDALDVTIRLLVE